MSARTLSVDPALRKVVTFHDLHDGRFAVDTVFDAQDIADHVQTLRDVRPATGDRYLGSIPMPMWAELRRTGILKDPQALQEWFAIHTKLQGKKR